MLTKILRMKLLLLVGRTAGLRSRSLLELNLSCPIHLCAQSSMSWLFYRCCGCQAQPWCRDLDSGEATASASPPPPCPPHRGQGPGTQHCERCREGPSVAEPSAKRNAGLNNYQKNLPCVTRVWRASCISLIVSAVTDGSRPMVARQPCQWPRSVSSPLWEPLLPYKCGIYLFPIVPSSGCWALTSLLSRMKDALHRTCPKLNS